MRTLDLYDFFSVLIPGVTFLLGFYPFYPEGIKFSSLAVIIPIALLGFVVGRGLHSAAVTIDRYFEKMSHRDLFIEELQNSNLLPESTHRAFYNRCYREYPELGLTGRIKGDVRNEKLMTALYVALRSTVHMDGRGRSRTFQAIHSFHRSMHLVSVVLFMVYLYYAYLLDNYESTNSIFPYVAKIDSLGFTSNFIIISAIVVLVISRYTFKIAEKDFQRYYIQYLILDFILISKERDS